MYLRIWVGQAAEVIAKEVMPLGLGQKTGEGGMNIRKDALQPVQKPFHLGLPAQEDAA